MNLSYSFLLCLTFFLFTSSWSFVPLTQRQRHNNYPVARRASPQDNNNNNNNNNTNNNTPNKNPLDFIFNPYESKIPKEIQKDIYAAEANTPAAQDRQKRIAGYIVVCFLGVLGAFFNAFLSELRMDVSLEEAGFGWVEQSNVLIRFALLNKIGGGVLLLGGAAAGLLAEAEYDTRRLQAERIFEEMQRRRAQKQGSVKPKKKRRENKRLNALAEIVETAVESPSTEEILQTQEKKEDAPQKKKEGLLGTIQGFYERADSMAASQALLLNKKLEDEGLIEKITDETGLKVIGRDAAQKLQTDTKAPPADDKDKNTP